MGVFQKNKWWHDYRYRGILNRLGTKMREEWKIFKQKQKQAQEAPIPVEYFNHIGKPIEVTIGYFTQGQLKEIKYIGILHKIISSTKYCKWSIDGVEQPGIHINSIKLL